MEQTSVVSAALIDTCVVLNAMGARGPRRQAPAMAALKQALRHTQPVMSISTRHELVYWGLHADIAPRIAFPAAVFIGNLCLQHKLVRPTTCFALCSNARDNRAIDAAVAGQARWLITESASLLRLKQVEQTRILTPQDFLQAQLESPRPVAPIRAGISATY